MDYQAARTLTDCKAWPLDEAELLQGVAGSSARKIDCVAIRLDRDPDHVDAAMEVLSDDERERAYRFVFKLDRERFVIARGALRRLLGTRLEIPPGEIEFRYSPYGKPELPDGFSEDELQFNASHSEGVAVFAFARGRRIGVDIEAVRPLPDADEVAASCFSQDELAAYRRLEADGRQAGFFNCWTRKEAFVKAVGDGLSYPLGDFDVSLVPGEPARLLRVGELPGDDCGWELNDIDGLAGFAGAVVIETSTNQVVLQRSTDGER
jgi:4'-phosphopantetheinyl transferase